MRVMMKMAAVSAVTVLLLCCCAFAATDAQNGCNILAAVGSDVIVELKYALKNTQQLQWKRNDSTIYRHNSIKVVTGNKGDVDDKGSLRLTKVDKTKEGMYRAEVHEDGKSQHTQSTILCTVDAVPQPTVKIECLKTPTVKFTCNVKQAKDVEYKWIHNNEVMEQEKGATLTLTESDNKWKDSQTDTFSCNVSNSVSTKSSAAVKQTCFRPKPLLPEKLWGINTWIIIGIGGGVVVLLIIIVIICCCQNRRKKRLRLKDEEELRLGWTNPNQQQHHHHHQHNHPPDHHHRHHHQQQPAGHTGPRQHRTKQHRSQQQQQQQQPQQQQQRPRAPDVPNGHPQPSPRRPAQAPRPAGNTDDEQPPPLPQPRKKAPKTPRE